jgi:hypothetical protein
MRYFPKAVTSLCLAAAGLYFSVYAHAELSAKAMLDKVYSEYDKKHQCWINSILAPYGKKIRELASIVASFDEWRILFDRNKWSYIKLQDWPLKDADF